MSLQNLSSQQQVEQHTHDCSICHNPSDENMSTCVQCHNVLHKNCGTVVDDTIFKCLSCSSIRPNSPTFSTTSRRSNRSRRSQSQKIDLQLKKLEEERKLNQDYLNKKYQLLEEAEALAVVSSQTSETINNWLASTESVAHQQPPSTNVSNNSNLPTTSLQNQHNIAQNPLNISALRTEQPITCSGSTVAPQNHVTFVPPTVNNAACNSSLPVYAVPNCTTNTSTSSGFQQMQSSRPTATITNPNNGLNFTALNNNAYNYSFPQEFIPQQPISSTSQFNFNAPMNSTHLPSYLPHCLSQTNISSRQSLPKDLPIFSGEPEEWPIFYSTYQWSTASCAFTNEENLIRLQKALKGEALNGVRHLLIHPSNVPDVMHVLYILFGQPEKIINTIKNKIQNAPKVDENNLKTLTSMAVQVRSLISTITASDMLDELNNSSILHDLIQKLPTLYQMQWATRKMQLINQNKKPNLYEFDKWFFNIGITASSITIDQHTNKGNKEKAINKSNAPTPSK